MNIVECTESALRAEMDKCAFQINVCVQNQSTEDAPEKFLDAIARYELASSQFEVLQKIKSQIPSSEETPPTQPLPNGASEEG